MTRQTLFSGDTPSHKVDDVVTALNKIDNNFDDLYSGAGIAWPGFVMSADGIVTDDTTARTLSADDNGKILYFTSASPVTITTAAGLGAGFGCTIIQGGAGALTVAQGASTTLASFGAAYGSAGQYAVLGIMSPVDDTFVLTGNLV